MPPQSPSDRSVKPTEISFLTPYWSGEEMMRIHLASVRRFHPHAPILVSKRGGGLEEMERHRREFGIAYWIEECGYMDAYLRLLERCETEYVCILDHDTVLLTALDGLRDAIAADSYDLVGIEERIRMPSGVPDIPSPPESNGWMRFAPGCTASNFILFNWRRFKARWGLRGVIAARTDGAKDYEFDYGIGQKLPRHKYLLPYHAPRYGLGNLLRDGDTAILWHQWYGSYRTRLQPGAAHPDESHLYSGAERGELAFVADYPVLDLSGLAPAWGPDQDIHHAELAFSAQKGFHPRRFVARCVRVLKRWRSYGVAGIWARANAYYDRWRRLR